MPKDQHPQDQKPPEDTGIPPGEAGDEAGEGEDKAKEEKIAGRYETKEDAEKGARDADAKIREQGGTINEQAARIKELEGREEKKSTIDVEEEKKKDAEAYRTIGEGMRKAYAEGGDEGMGRYLDQVIEAHPGVRAGRAVQAQIAGQQRYAAIYGEMKKRHSDYDELIPKMKEIGAKLSPGTMANPTTELMETLYKAAKAEVFPDEAALRKKLADEEKAGTGQGAGERKVKEKDTRTEDEKKVDKAVEQYQKDKPQIR